MIFFFILVIYLVDIVLVLYGEILSWSLMGVKRRQLRTNVFAPTSWPTLKIKGFSALNTLILISMGIFTSPSLISLSMKASRKTHYLGTKCIKLCCHASPERKHLIHQSKISFWVNFSKTFYLENVQFFNFIFYFVFYYVLFSICQLHVLFCFSPLRLGNCALLLSCFLIGVTLELSATDSYVVYTKVKFAL